ncbi:MAG: hypothetical protein QOK28_3635 [Actinomycetota bacterium]|jgi:hypothetical protein
MPNDLDLDDRIRSLVSAAVKTAPVAPHIDPLRAPSAAQRPPWLRRSAIALAALLAAGGGYAVLQPASDDHVDTGGRTPATVPAPAPEQPPVIVTAGPDGIVERVGDDKKTITDEPFAMALALDDGTFVAQRHTGESRRDGITWPRSDTSVVRVDQRGKSTPLFEAKTGFVILHDFAVVDGRRLLLYSVDVNNYASGKEELYALDLDGADHPLDVGTIGGWEATTSRLTLSSTGLIVGTSYGVCCQSGNFIALAVPDSAAAARPLPKATDFGLADGYEDGCACPTGFAVDPDGTAIYWLSPVDGGATFTVVRATLDDPLHTSEVAPVARLDSSTFGRMSIDADDSRFVVSFDSPYSESMQPPMLFTPDRSATFEGEFATLGPNG